jgi:hypothetical protein
MKKILRAALSLGILALAVSAPVKASYSDCLDYCEYWADQCQFQCETLTCHRQCADFYADCVSHCQ